MSDFYEKKQTRFIKNEKKKDGYVERIVTENVTGTVKFFDEEKGYGFIRTGNTQDVFFHCTKLPEGLNVIEEGLPLVFDVAETRKGLQAVNIRVEG